MNASIALELPFCYESRSSKGHLIFGIDMPGAHCQTVRSDGLNRNTN
jgi:hypothetical protein